MTLKLQLILLICSLLFTGVIVNMLRKELLDIKYSLTWILSGMTMILLALQPKLALAFAHVLGIVEPVNAIFLVAILFAIAVSFSLTVALSRQTVRLRKLSQEVALLEKTLHDLSAEQREKLLIKP